MPDQAKPKRKPIFTSYVFKNPGTEVGGSGGPIATIGGDPKDAVYIVHTFQYEDPPIADLNAPTKPTPNE